MSDKLMLSTSDEIVELGKNIEGTLTLARSLHKSGMFPKIANEFQTLVLIEYGRELGIQPVMALQTIFVVNGRLSMESKLMLALFQQRGGKIKIIQHDKKACVIEYSKEGQAPATISFSWEDVITAGLAGKDNYKNYPTDMMFARNISRGVKSYDPGAILGLVSVEEAVDLEPLEIKAVPLVETRPYVKDGGEAAKKDIGGSVPPAEIQAPESQSRVDAPKAEITPPASPQPPSPPLTQTPQNVPAKRGRPPVTKPSPPPTPQAEKPTTVMPDPKDKVLVAKPEEKTVENEDIEDLSKPVISADKDPYELIAEFCFKIFKRFKRAHTELVSKLCGKINDKYRLAMTAEDFPQGLNQEQAQYIISLLTNTWDREETLEKEKAKP